MAHCACSCSFWRWFRGFGQAVWRLAILGGHGSSACFPPLIDSQPSQRSVSGVGLLRYGCLKVVRAVIWPVPTVHFCACHQC
ncbi:hypothetical protein QR685DRAFT_572039 [Neurospora intermedia]|uniref:Secreted protein n=1 Tax=Neurospora intermedia TaxID=5142 RepID=A0ABR3DE88_NEUIN